MKRKALIIGNPGEPGAENYCRGVDKDLENYSAFLKSPLGGNWYADEIAVLRRPTAQEARAAIQTLKSADYSFVVFSGHGCTDARTSSLRLELKSGHELAGNELRQGASRHTVIYDCCRAIAASTLTEDRMMKALLAKAEVSATASRRYFEKAILDCAEGLIALFACSAGELANDDAQSGGYYSSSLVLGAKTWSDSGQFDLAKHYYLYSVIEAHAAAEIRVRARSGNRQNPNIEKPRSSPYFPFAIMAA